MDDQDEDCLHDTPGAVLPSGVSSWRQEVKHHNYIGKGENYDHFHTFYWKLRQYTFENNFRICESGHLGWIKTESPFPLHFDVNPTTVWCKLPPGLENEQKDFQENFFFNCIPASEFVCFPCLCLKCFNFWYFLQLSNVFSEIMDSMPVHKSWFWWNQSICPTPKLVRTAGKVVFKGHKNGFRTDQLFYPHKLPSSFHQLKYKNYVILTRSDRGRSFVVYVIHR